jgi:Trk K+ transport system NAD-binding subunit
MILSPESKELVIRLLKKDLVDAEDNLCRARMQKRHDPNWKTGNGEPIDEVIASYQEWADRTQKALHEMQ